MSKIDYLGLDGSTLKTFLAVLEEGSVSIAASRLGVSQSAVSHTLDRLRLTLGDPLFVRAGRGIQPTARAQSLRVPIESILAELRSLTYEREFDPRLEPMEITIAANDFPLELIFPTLLRELYADGINPRFQFIPAGVPSADLLRTSRCQMLITPAPPEGKDIHQQRLFCSKMVCFYDAEIRKPPTTWQQFVDSKYAEVKFSEVESARMVLPEIDISALKTPTVTVPNFTALSAFIKGTELITASLSLMSQTLLKNLNSAPLPLKTKPLNIYLAWHRRDHDDPAHNWLRQRIKDTVNSILRD